jgi:ribosomal protein S25
MAKSKKTSTSKSKTIQKIHQLMATDIFKSVAVVSILTNLLFIIFILVGSQYPTVYLTKGDYKQRAARLEQAQKDFCRKDIIDEYLQSASTVGNEQNAKVSVATICGAGDYGEQVRDLKEQLINQETIN